MTSFDSKHVCAVVLAGGMGSRMGGVDKGLQAFNGSPLVAHTQRAFFNANTLAELHQLETR